MQTLKVTITVNGVTALAIHCSMGSVQALGLASLGFSGAILCIVNNNAILFVTLKPISSDFVFDKMAVALNMKYIKISGLHYSASQYKLAI